MSKSGTLYTYIQLIALSLLSDQCDVYVDAQACPNLVVNGLERTCPAIQRLLIAKQNEDLA